MQFHGNSLPKNIAAKEKKHHHSSQFINENIQALASREGSGTELILKCVLIGAYKRKQLTVLNTQNH